MDAGKLWMLQDFIGTNKVLFRIPVYQRNYDWSDVNCNKLLDDIKQIIDTGESIFSELSFICRSAAAFIKRIYHHRRSATADDHDDFAESIV